MNYGVIILAAGKGTRMNSVLPKVLHPIGGKPMVTHLIDNSKSIGCDNPIVVYGHQGEMLRTRINNDNIIWVEQQQQLGTGHAVLQSLPHIDDNTTYLILVGDAPLITQKTLKQLLTVSQQTGIAVLTVNVEHPFGYGRMVRDQDGHIQRIVEEKETTPAEQAINEINSGVFAIKGNLLKSLLPQINNNNAQEEYYLTDIVALAKQAGHPVIPYMINDSDEVLGCNNKIQLAQLERIYQSRQAQQLMTAGVTLMDPERIDIRGTVQTGIDVSIDINTILEGKIYLGDNVIIEANCIIKNSQIGANSTIRANTIIEDAQIGEEVEVGPFARIRPKTELANCSKIGNFVETKNAKIASGSKVNHLSYIGDAIIGQSVNIGAGTITCNYDGANKHLTTIEDNVFIGSNSALIAPVTLGKGATVGAGSTISKDIKENHLALTRGKQTEIKNWQRPSKK